MDAWRLVDCGRPRILLYSMRVPRFKQCSVRAKNTGMCAYVFFSTAGIGFVVDQGEGRGLFLRLPLSVVQTEKHTVPTFILVSDGCSLRYVTAIADHLSTMLTRTLQVFAQSFACLAAAVRIVTCSAPGTVHLSCQYITVSSHDSTSRESYRPGHHSRNTSLSCATKHCVSYRSSIPYNRNTRLLCGSGLCVSG